MNKSESKYFRTAQKMDLALISLLKKKPLAYISVSELCETAGVNRSTFYLHYESIGELLNEATQYLIDGFLSYFISDPRSIQLDVAACEPHELNFICDRYLTPYLTYIKENREIFATAMANGSSLGFDRIYARMFAHFFDPILDRFRYPQEDRRYVMMYYLSGISAINAEWLKDNCQKPIAEIARIIQECIFGLNGQLLPLCPPHEPAQ